MAFDNTLIFPDHIGFWASGGAQWNTMVQINDGGWEKRNQNWAQQRGKWDISNGMKTPAEGREVIDFFNAVKGRLDGFRFRDWRDYTVTKALDNGLINEAGVGNGSATGQLQKRYSRGALSSVRQITRPRPTVAVPVLVYSNNVLLTAGVDYTLDDSTGVITWTGTSKSVASVSKASNGVVVTNTAHNFSTGNVVVFGNMGTMTQLSNQSVTVTVSNATAFTIGVNTTNYSNYSGGGAVTKYQQAQDTLRWEGQFDNPVRFDTDAMGASYDPGGLFVWEQVPLVELRE